jgi:hypothetical protein
MSHATTKLVRPGLAASATVESVWQLARLEEGLPSGGSAYADIYELDDDGNLALTGDRVRAWAYSVPGYYTVPAGTIVRIEWHDTMARWFVTGVYD